MRTWLAIPALAVVCAAIAMAAGAGPFDAAAVGALGAALAAAVRAFAGASFAATMAAATGALLGAIALADSFEPARIALAASAEPARVALAAACALFAIAELARPLPVAGTSPWPAMGGAIVAAVLDPSFVAMPVIAGLRVVTGPWSRPRWTVALPIVGGLAIVACFLAAASHGGAFADLWHAWAGGVTAQASGASSALDIAGRAGDALGPLAIVAALAGLASCAAASRFAAAAVAAVAVGAALVSLRSGALAPALPLAAALACGVAVARLAALVRHPAGQACVCGTAGFVLLVAPAWTLALG